MRILHDSSLTTQLSNVFLFLDTSVFIAAIKHKEFAKFLFDLKDSGCTFLTIPSVLFEFTRGSDSLQVYNERASFVSNLAAVYNVERFLKEVTDLVLALQKICNTASYTDFLLGICSGKFNCDVLTENHKDFPDSVYQRRFVITLDTETQIRNYAVYCISQSKIKKVTQKIL